MDKIKLNISKRSDVRVNFFGTEILVSPIISIDEQKKLRNICFNSMFENGMTAEWEEYLFDFSMRYGVLSLKTNIDMSELKDEELEELIWGEYYEKVTSSIINYKEATGSILYSLSNEIRKQENNNSLMGVVNSLLEKIQPIIEQFKNISPEELEKLKESLNDIIKQTKSEPIVSVLSDMGGNKTKRKSKKDKEYVQ